MRQWEWNGIEKKGKIQLTFIVSDNFLSSFLFFTSQTGLYGDTYIHVKDEEIEIFYDLQKYDAEVRFLP